MLEILQVIAALATIATGVYSLVAPLKVRGFTGLNCLAGAGSQKCALCSVDFSLPWALPRSSLAQRICS